METIFTTSDIAYCHGDGPSGHPGIFLNLNNQLLIKCPYCSQAFQQVSELNQPLSKASSAVLPPESKAPQASEVHPA
jgi:uncharacterized Zn-finger protein